MAFLLTDVEGSTRLLARVGTRYPSMIAAHRGIIAAAAQRAGGEAVPMEGDACLATFPSATAAIRAAVDVQRTLAAHDWGDDPLRVRIGVHAGQAMLHDGEYFGLDLHRAARVADAGHGGQSSCPRARSSRSSRSCRPGSDCSLWGSTGYRTWPHPCTCSR